jgi:hypothetical protein
MDQSTLLAMRTTLRLSTYVASREVERFAIQAKLAVLRCHEVLVVLGALLRAAIVFGSG